MNIKMESLLIRIIIAILITIGTILSLALGSYFAQGIKDTFIRNVIAYDIPLIYMYVVYYFANKFNLINDSFFENKKIKFKGIKTFIIGLLSMIIPLTLSFMGDILPLIGKDVINNYLMVLFLLIGLSICIGVFEENIFRGIIFRILLKDNSRNILWISFMFSSFLFGIVHLGNLSIESKRPLAVTAQVVYAIFLGMLFSALYLKFKSIVGVAILHAFVDFISFYPELYGKGDLASGNNTDISLVDACTVIGMFLPSAIIAIIIIILFTKKYYLYKIKH